ncbi:conserved hypothetical protein [Tenacibaculum maritimum]|uniref:hypothetical protein n=1 Tax=Tenacibaculum maritimum TaxID=107401 RepID=UPI0012E5A0B4|nr:hypothetical protein [Tenacibaculum maritimum]MDB0600854.1 hypothetical protein [Tenacibaculum maritimum]MDB0612024.1 hypothetical protein [Tenacibaculum maritimum]CAA0203404.1 conserved hypothetical protein [Tenacibaculum maritimum]
MNLKSYQLSDSQIEQLKTGIKSSLSIPLIDSLEDFIWEAIFCYAKGVELVDPLFTLRKKLLFDVVDKPSKIGWSAKSLQCNIYENCEFELVIQRADIFKKQKELGFDNLTKETDPNTLGEALLVHWHKKVIEDAKVQEVEDFRVCVLLKTSDNTKYAYFEEDLALYSKDDLYWRWTNDTKTGLQGVRKSDDFVVYRWYPNQKQFFERFKLYDNASIINLEIERKSMEELINLLGFKK